LFWLGCQEQLTEQAITSVVSVSYSG